MSRLSAEDALELVFTAPMEELDSGGELDIEEDPDFPLSTPSEGTCSESESETDEDSDDGECMSRATSIHI